MEGEFLLGGGDGFARLDDLGLNIRDRALEFLVGLVGTRRIVLGTDLPFDMGDAAPVDRVRRVAIDPDELGATAAGLLGLSRAG